MNKKKLKLCSVNFTYINQIVRFLKCAIGHGLQGQEEKLLCFKSKFV